MGSVGLRGRLTAALVITSALTLAVVALALLAPLDRRLRSDAVHSLTETTLAARPTFVRVPLRDVHPGSKVLSDSVEDVRRRTGDEVAAVSAHGVVLAATDPDAAAGTAAAARAVREDRVVTGVVSSPEGLEARVAVPVRRREAPYALSVQRRLTSLESAAGVVGRGFLVAAVAGMVLALLAGILLATRLVRRLNALRDTVLQVGSDPDGGGAVALRDGARDEVGDLTRAFAGMQRRLEDQERARRNFVSTASHELGTPLASLQLMLGNLVEDLDGHAPDIADAREQVLRASAQSTRLRRLAADLLDLSRLDAAVPLRAEPVDLREVTRAVVAEFADRATLELDADEPCWVTADPGSVAQILRILFDNAARAARGGSAVAIGLAVVDGRCEVTVRDEGPGVPPADRERIFERFQRGSLAPDGAGFGLGLAIGRELARRMRGDVRLAATEPGACFVLELPAPSA